MLISFFRGIGIGYYNRLSNKNAEMMIRNSH